MLVISRFAVSEADGADFLDRARAALAAFAARPGFVRGRVGRAADEPTLWALVTEWDRVGSFRRALSDFDVRVHAAPLLAESIEEPAALEILAGWEGGVETGGRTDRATDAGTTALGAGPPHAGPHDAGPPHVGPVRL